MPENDDYLIEEDTPLLGYVPASKISAAEPNSDIKAKIDAVRRKYGKSIELLAEAQAQPESLIDKRDVSGEAREKARPEAGTPAKRTYEEALKWKREFEAKFHDRPAVNPPKPSTAPAAQGVPQIVKDRRKRLSPSN